MKTNLNGTQLLATLVAIADTKDLSAFISNNIGGLENRFIRQELMKEITGMTIPLVKCGISHLVEAIDTFRNDPKNEMDLSLMGTPSIEEESASEVIDLVTPPTTPTADVPNRLEGVKVLAASTSNTVEAVELGAVAPLEAEVVTVQKSQQPGPSSTVVGNVKRRYQKTGKFKKRK